MKPYLMHQLRLDAPRLPFAFDALEPTFSRRAVEVHYRQHQAYCRKTAELVAETIDSGTEGLGGLNPLLQDVVRYAAKHTDTPGPRDLFSQAAQAWNHAFLWLSFRGRGPQPELEQPGAYAETHFAQCAERSGFSSLDDLKREFIEIATDSFGSGWAWLVLDGDAVSIRLSDNAGTFLENTDGTPLLVVDLWEHAYFLDHGFGRADYVKAVITDMLDWDWAADRVHMHLFGD